MHTARLRLITIGIFATLGCGNEAQEIVSPGQQSRAVAGPSEHVDEMPEASLSEDAIAQPAAPVKMSEEIKRLLVATELDHAWFAHLASSEAGQIQAASTLGGQSEAQWESMGYLPTADGSFQRQVPLAEKVSPEGLVPTASEAMPGVDAVAMITIDRDNGQEPYVYSTLRSVFSVFPPETQVNLLVGDANTAYVAKDILTREIGAEWASRVHVWPTDPQTHTFIHQRFLPQRRGGWNYARALRSYAGSRGLILMEDDVVWAPSAIDDMGRLLNTSPLATTFYNFACFGPSDANPQDMPTTVLHEVRVRDSKFVCTQGMYFTAALANRLGEHIHRRIHERVWDYIMELLFQDQDLMMGFTLPSLVQHTGVQSAGVTPWFHTTPCFAGDVLHPPTR